jgi:3-dehydroquinate dehydratase-2
VQNPSHIDLAPKWPVSAPLSSAGNNPKIERFMATILVLNGPNLNLLGTREPDLYGADTLDSIQARLEQMAGQQGHNVDCYQSNAEHELVDRIHAARGDGVGFIIINPAAFTHSSVALRDALLGAAIPFIEVHLSNIHAREEFRKRSFFSDIAEGVISGLGAQSYELALQAALHRVDTSPES